MATFKFAKVVSSLPGTLDADTIYAVRVGEGFDLYVSDSTGSAAHQVNRRNPKITVSSTAPSSPDVGDVWVDTN